MGQKPLYVLRFIDSSPAADVYHDKFYSGKHAWMGVDKADAARMTHKVVRRVQGHLKQPRIGLVTEIVPA